MGDKERGRLFAIEIDGSDGVLPFIIKKDKLLIGRGDSCEIRIKVNGVLPKHCVISFSDEGRGFVEPVTKSCLTFLNGELIDRQVSLEHNDVITIVKRSFRFFYPSSSNFYVALQHVTTDSEEEKIEDHLENVSCAIQTDVPMIDTENPKDEDLSFLDSKAFQKRLLRWMAETSKKLEEHSIMLSEILLHLQAANSNNITIKEEELPMLPVKSMTEFKMLEDYIDNESNFNKLVKYLSKKGGNGVNDITKRVLKAVMDYKIAIEFNWAGRGEKRPFKESKIKMLIICAVRGSSQNASDKEIEESIKTFLKYAPLRVKYAYNKSMT